MKILLVDNYHGKPKSSLLESINYFSENHHFYGVENAKDAWGKLHSRSYDAILVDVSEDVAVRGLDILSEAVARDFPNITRICWSASIFSFDITELNNHYHLIINKGIAPTSLIKAIDDVINSRLKD